MRYFLIALAALVALAHSADESCCKRLSRALPGKVHLPDTTTYDDRIESIFSATASLEPWCIVLPETTEDVSDVMIIINKGSCPFGIRSGGHAVYANANSVTKGITIDLGYLNATTYQPGDSHASIQPGARWGYVYDVLAKDGIAVVGGRVTGVGVGGLILGGGNSFHSGRYGFACDTVQAYEVVLANGTIVTATADSHVDLFRGLCGGSGNLGIVTRFDMMTVTLNGGKEKPYIWGGTGSWAYDNLQLVDELVGFTNRADEDDGCSVFCGWLWVNARAELPYSSACALQHVDDKANASLFDGLRLTPGSLGNTYRHAPLSEHTEEISGLVRHQRQNIWGSSTFKADPETIRFAIEQHKILSEQLSVLLADDPDASALLIFQPLTIPLLSHGANKNMLGMEDDAKDGPGMFTLLIVQASSKENENLARPLVRAFEKSIDDFAEESGASWRWTYLNYVDFYRDPIANYGPKNVQFLQSVAKAYDPNRVFQILRQSGHKLPKEY